MAPPERTDRQLIEAYSGGDQSAFTALYEKYRRPLYSYLNRMLPGQPSTVDDLYQKTWMKAIDNFAKYEDRQTFFAWIVRIGHNTAIDHFRRESRNKPVDIDTVPLAADGPVPSETMSSAELAVALDRAIAELPEDQREVVVLRRQGVPFKDIADMQGCSLNTALGRMHYAVSKMRQTLQEWTA